MKKSMADRIRTFSLALLLIIQSVQSLAVNNVTNEEKNSERIANEKKSGEKTASDKSVDEITDIVNRLDYPELQVVPRATERLKIEAKEEETSWYYDHWQFELSGLATLGAAIQAKGQMRDGLSQDITTQENNAILVGEVIGGGWLMAGILLGASRPYRSGMNLNAKYTGKDERSVLLRERMAEETLEKPARTIRPLQWLAVVSNLAANAFLSVYLNNQGMAVAGVAGLLAFTPFVYEDHSVLVYEKQLEYKTRIYGPVPTSGLGYDFEKHAYYPKTGLMWMF